jgi:hypothetical protein
VGENTNNFYNLSPVTSILSVYSLGMRVASATEFSMEKGRASTHPGTRKGTGTVDLNGCGGLDGVVSIATFYELGGLRIGFW